MPRSLVQSFMSSVPLSLSPETRIEEAEKLLWESQVSDVYIVDVEEYLIGVVPDYDFLKRRSLDLCGRGTLSTIMSPVSTALSVDDSIEKAISLLCQNIHSNVPVVDQQKLVGVVDRSCVVRGLCNLRQEAEMDRCIFEEKLNHGAISAPKFLQTGDFGRRKLGGSRKFPAS